MFNKKKLKNPISVIRKPEEINKEYSDLVIKLGQLQLEKAAIYGAEIAQEKRKDEIKTLSDNAIERIKELTEEMNEAQAELAKKTQPAPTQQANTPEARL